MRWKQNIDGMIRLFDPHGKQESVTNTDPGTLVFILYQTFTFDLYEIDAMDELEYGVSSLFFSAESIKLDPIEEDDTLEGHVIFICV